MKIKRLLLKALLLLPCAAWSLGASAQATGWCPDSNHPHLIDLGLPSGTKWACCNVGASAPQDYGDYYAWGETAVKDYYHWNSYEYGNANLGQCQSIGSNISGTDLDAARIVWGGQWQMPTLAQYEELIANCAFEESQLDGVNGGKFTAPNGNSIFLPDGGVFWDVVVGKDTYGRYWSGTVNTDNDQNAYFLEFEGNEAKCSSSSRCSGRSVRPVQNKQVVITNTEGYPTGTVKYDNVPAENVPMVKQLFNDLRLVPEGGNVKRFYITVNEVRSDLWTALMAAPIDEGESAEEDADNIGTVPTEAAIQAFVTLLRQQTGKRFRLPTAEERRRAAECQVIDTIADATDSYGAGFHLALDTIGRARPMMLVITAKDGSQSSYRLRTLPRVTVEKPYLIVRADGTEISFDLDELLYMHYEEDPTPTGIDTVSEPKAAADKEEETILFNNLPTGTTVSIFTTDGKQVYSHASDGNTLSLPLSSLKSGVYIVKANGLTYKIQKP